MSTYNLYLRDIFLPPNGFLEAFIPHSQQVVHVHNDVYNRIQSDQESAVPACGYKGQINVYFKLNK